MERELERFFFYAEGREGFPLGVPSQLAGVIFLFAGLGRHHADRAADSIT